MQEGYGQFLLAGQRKSQRQIKSDRLHLVFHQADNLAVAIIMAKQFAVAVDIIGPNHLLASSLTKMVISVCLLSFQSFLPRCGLFAILQPLSIGVVTFIEVLTFLPPSPSI